MAVHRSEPSAERWLDPTVVNPDGIVDNLVDTGQTESHEPWGALHDHARRLLEGCVLPADDLPDDPDERDELLLR